MHHRKAGESIQGVIAGFVVKLRIPIFTRRTEMRLSYFTSECYTKVVLLTNSRAGNIPRPGVSTTLQFLLFRRIAWPVMVTRG